MTEAHALAEPISDPELEEVAAPPPPNAMARLTAWLLPGTGLHEHAFRLEEVKDLLDGVYARGDRIMGRILNVHAVIALALAFVYGTWAVTVACTFAAVGMFVIARAMAPRTFLTRCVAGIALQTFVALHIYQLHGLAEMHFFFFTAFTTMIVYQDWIAMWPGALLIISQHILFAVLHNTGVNLFFFENRFISFTKLFFHFGIAIVHVGLCGYWAYLNREHTLSSAWQRRGLERQRLRIAGALDRSQRSEQAERSMSHLLGTLVEHVPGAILVEDESQQLRHVNRGYCELAGLEGRLEDVRRQDCGELAERLCARAVDGESVRATMLAAKRRNGATAGEELVLTDGRAFEWDLVPLLLDGETRGYLWHFREITARKQAEAERDRLEGELRQSQKMQAIGTLAGGVAHDFNNILGAIMGHTELASATVAPTHPMREHLDEVIFASRRAAGLVRQILAFSRREETHRVPLDLGAVVSDAVRLLRASAPANVRMVTDGAESGLWAKADASQLQQVLINLGSNAVHAQPRGGSIEFRLSRVDFQAATIVGGEELQPGAYACLSVRDAGAGMEPSVLQRMFEPFFTTKPAGQGTGLGLAVVHGIVTSHGGAIQAESALGQGTCLRVHLPLVPAAGAVATCQRTDSEAIRGNGEHIMVVDDESSIATSRGMLLERLGYQVSVHLDPTEALKDFRRRPEVFDLVFTDHMMPAMDGLQLVDCMLAARPELAVLLTSGNTLAFAMDDRILQRVRGLLPKPSSAEELALAVHRALQPVPR